MTKIIIGKVAELLSDRSLIINRGSNDGVRLNMVFKVYDAVGKEVKDPDTGEDLGRVNLPKIEVAVTHVYEKYSIAQTHKYKEINVGGTWTGVNVANIFTPPKYVKKYETFEIDESTQKKIDEKKSMVKIGDVVEQVLLNEEVNKE
jgi:hypothetical protein